MAQTEEFMWPIDQLYIELGRTPPICYTHKLVTILSSNMQSLEFVKCDFGVLILIFMEWYLICIIQWRRMHTKL